MNCSETSGIALTYLPGISSFRFKVQQKTTPGLTPQEHAKMMKDPGETYALRLYPIQEESCVILKNHPLVRQKYAQKMIDVIPEKLIPHIFKNNEIGLKLRSQLKYVDNLNNLGFITELVGIPLEVYLSKVWAILGIVNLDFIRPTDFTGRAHTSIGDLQVKSY